MQLRLKGKHEEADKLMVRHKIRECGVFSRLCLPIIEKISNTFAAIKPYWNMLLLQSVLGTSDMMVFDYLGPF